LPWTCEEEQKVEAGQLLVEIDPRDYQTALTQAAAVMESKQAAWHAARQNCPGREHGELIQRHQFG
jgi:membrane fusion protein (multidrug efflux system)